MTSTEPSTATEPMTATDLTPRLAPPNRPTGGGDPHGVEPSRIHLWLGLGFLALGFAVDLAQFRQVVGRVAPDLTDFSVWLIAVGAGAIALYMMFEAGRLEAERRATTSGRHGRGTIRLIVSVWALLGLVATYVRLTVLPPGSTSGGFGSTESAGTAGGFGTAGATGSASAFYPAELPLALLMLVLYLAVGIGAYQFALRSHRPLLTELRRARSHEKRARRRLKRMTRTYDDREAPLVGLRQQLEERTNERRATSAGSSLTAALAEHRAATDRRASLTAELSHVRQERAKVEAELASLDTATTAQHRLAAAAGGTARHHARALLHEHLADPVRTVKDVDHPASRPDAHLEA